MLSYLSTKYIENIPKIFIVSEMSSIGNIIDCNYSDNCYKIAQKYKELVIGFISQSNPFNDKQFLIATPGININCVNEKIKNIEHQNKLLNLEVILL